MQNFLSLSVLFIRSFLANSLFYLNTFLWMIVFLPLFILPRRFGVKALHGWARSSRWLMDFIAGISFEVRGEENLPEGGYLIASKHQSAWETFGLLPLFDDPAFILKKELMYIPLFGWFARKFGMIPVQRKKRRTALTSMLAHARKAVHLDQRQVLIFPEGTRKAIGAEPDYKYGIAWLYDALDVPCVPIALNSGKYWPRRRFMRMPGTILIDILPALQPGLPPKVFLEQLENTIESASKRLL